MDSASRNDPCPCGSGKKYKRCHLAVEEARPPSLEERAQAFTRVDRKLAPELLRFARRTFPQWDPVEEFERRADGDFEDRDLSVPWMTFHCPIKGRSLAEWFLEQGRLDEDERAVLSAQVRAWLSTWEVLHVEPGRSIELHDLLTGERRTVIEKLGSICVQPMQVILARVIDLGDDLSVLCGLHPIPLPPREADAVVRKVRQALRKRTRPIEPARLRAETNSRRRADALRSQLEAVAGDLLRHRVREHADVEAALLKQIEFGEAQVPMGERYDVARLRRALGLGDSTSRNAR